MSLQGRWTPCPLDNIYTHVPSRWAPLVDIKAKSQFLIGKENKREVGQSDQNRLCSGGREVVTSLSELKSRGETVDWRSHRGRREKTKEPQKGRAGDWGRKVRSSQEDKKMGGREAQCWCWLLVTLSLKGNVTTFNWKCRVRRLILTVTLRCH